MSASKKEKFPAKQQENRTHNEEKTNQLKQILN